MALAEPGSFSASAVERASAPILSGSSTLTSALLEHGLADEVNLLVNPVLLGKGNVVNTYKAAGPLQNLR